MKENLSKLFQIKKTAKYEIQIKNVKDLIFCTDYKSIETILIVKFPTELAHIKSGEYKNLYDTFASMKPKENKNHMKIMTIMDNYLENNHISFTINHLHNHMYATEYATYQELLSAIVTKKEIKRKEEFLAELLYDISFREFNKR